MFHTTTDQRTNGPRIQLETSVRLLSFGQPKALWANTKNLGSAGMFVETADLCPVNTELICDLFLPSARLPVRGLVAWVQHQPICGMGIMFLDLSDQDRRMIREMVAEETQGTESVKVWMETLAQPIRAQAVRSGDDMTLKSQLSFLKLSSPVLVYSADREASDRRYSGILQNVTLSTRPNLTDPVLQLHLKIQDPPVPEEAGQQRICTPIISAEDPTPGSTTNEPTTQESKQLLRLDDEPAYTLAVAAAPDCQETWEVDLTDLDTSHWQLQGPELPTDSPTESRPRRQRHPWLWLAALAMAGVAVASVVHTGLHQRVLTRVQGWLSAPPDLSTIEKDVASLYPPAGPQAPVVLAKADPQPAAPQEALTPPPAPVDPPVPVTPAHQQKNARPPAAAAPAQGAPELPSSPARVDGNTLEVTLGGSTEGATSYKLARPNGIAINLPRADAQGRIGLWKVGQGRFRTVWLRQRDEGVQLRVLVKGDLPEFQLKLSPRKVQVSIN